MHYYNFFIILCLIYILFIILVECYKACATHIYFHAPCIIYNKLQFKNPKFKKEIYFQKMMLNNNIKLTYTNNFFIKLRQIILFK